MLVGELRVDADPDIAGIGGVHSGRRATGGGRSKPTGSFQRARPAHICFTDSAVQRVPPGGGGGGGGGGGEHHEGPLGALQQLFEPVHLVGSGRTSRQACRGRSVGASTSSLSMSSGRAMTTGQAGPR